MNSAAQILSGPKNGGRQSDSDRARKEKWDRVLDLAHKNEITQDHLKDAMAVMSVIACAYSAGNQPTQSEVISQSCELLNYVSNGLKKRFATR